MGYFDDLIDPAPSVTTADPVAAGSVAPATKSAPATTEATNVEPDSTGDETKFVISETATNANEPNETESTGSADNSGVVPESITNRAATSELRTRFHDHQALNDMVREDWIKAIKLDPDAYDALLFRALSTTDVVINDDGYEATSAQKIDPNQETLRYADPELVVLADCPDEMSDFYAMNDTDENAGVVDDALILRIAAHNISIGSILEWNESLASGESVRRWWYVHRKFNYGTASVGTLYYCVPSRSYEGMLDE